jgi:hypothetical protein
MKVKQAWGGRREGRWKELAKFIRREEEEERL